MLYYTGELETVFTVSEEKSGGDGRGGPWPSEKEVQQEVEEVE